MLLSIGLINIITKFGQKFDGIRAKLCLLKNVEEIEIGCDNNEQNYDIFMHR